MTTHAGDAGIVGGGGDDVHAVAAEPQFLSASARRLVGVVLALSGLVLVASAYATEAKVTGLCGGRCGATLEPVHATVRSMVLIPGILAVVMSGLAVAGSVRSRAVGIGAFVVAATAGALAIHMLTSIWSATYGDGIPTRFLPVPAPQILVDLGGYLISAGAVLSAAAVVVVLVDQRGRRIPTTAVH